MKSELLALVMLLFASETARCQATMQEASFALTDGRLEVVVTNGSMLVSEFQIRVRDADGNVFIEGSQERPGRVAFAVLDHEVITIELSSNGKEADPIILKLKNARWVPEHVHITFGTRPCCRPVAKSSPGDSSIDDELSPAAAIWIIGIGLTSAAMLLAWLHPGLGSKIGKGKSCPKKESR